MRNRLYYTENYIKGKLVEDTVLKHDNVTTLDISKKDAHHLVGILFANTSTSSHRCITVYRDAVVLGNNTYNVCLSCGDFYENNRHYYLNDEGVKEFTKYKEKLLEDENK